MKNTSLPCPSTGSGAACRTRARPLASPFPPRDQPIKEFGEAKPPRTPPEREHCNRIDQIRHSSLVTRNYTSDYVVGSAVG